MYGEMGALVFEASIASVGLISRDERSSRLTLSYHAFPVAWPQPPSRQLIWIESSSPVSNATERGVQFVVPVRARVATPWMLWRLKSAPRPFEGVTFSVFT